MPSPDTKRQFDHKVVWRVSRNVADQFLRLIFELGRAEDQLEERQHLLDQIKALPGFPAHADPDHDLIQLDIEKRIIVH